MVTAGYQAYGDQFVMYINAESLYDMPEINILLCVNYSSIKRKRLKEL